MDLVTLAIGAFGAVVTIAGFVAAVYVGSRRGVRETASRLSAEQKELISTLQQRVEALAHENERQGATIAALQLEVAKLRAELDVEKRITARMEHAQAAAHTMTMTVEPQP